MKKEVFKISAIIIIAVISLVGFKGFFILPVQSQEPSPSPSPEPYCGNNTIEGGEECDGSDDSACPDNCLSNCECPASSPSPSPSPEALCGNNAVDADEDCDGSIDSACPGECDDCKCPVCGNNTREGNEECDGGDAQECPGLCRPAGDPDGECKCWLCDDWCKNASREGSCTGKYLSGIWAESNKINVFAPNETYQQYWTANCPDSDYAIVSPGVFSQAEKSQTAEKAQIGGKGFISRILAAIGLIPAKSSQEQASLSAEPEIVECSDYYEGNEISLKRPSATPKSVKAGEKISFKIDVVNEKDYPIADGMLFVKIYRAKEGRTELQDDYLIDEFVAVKNVNLWPKEEKTLSFDWVVPENSFSGGYKVDFLFANSKHFNLSGVTYLPKLFGNAVSFNVEGKETGFWLGEITETHINKVKINLSTWTPFYNGGDVKISVPLKNNLGQGEVAVSVDLYYFDSLEESNKLSQYHQEKNVSLSADEEILEFEFPNPDVGAYLAKITAQADGRKSSLNIRFGIIGARGRFLFSGLSSFPVQKNKNYALFSCFGNGVDYFTFFDGKVKLELQDKKTGKIIAATTYEGNISRGRTGIKKDFTASKNSSKELLLISRLYDDKGNLMDEVKTEYNAAKFSAAGLPPKEKLPLVKIIIVILSIIALLTILYFLIKKLWKKTLKNSPF